MTRRFYTTVRVTVSDQGHGITLDGRDVRTPARNPLLVPTRALAEAMAREWDAQPAVISLPSMPLNGLANAAIDLAMPDPVAFAAPIAAYGEGDLLCYRAPDPALAAQQAALWNPILDWAERRWGIEFTLTDGIMHVAQPDRTKAVLAEEVAACDAFRLAALSPITSIGGSLVGALALAQQAFTPDRIWDAVTLDERWQEDQWGAVDDAVEAREEKRAAWMHAATFLMLLDDAG